MNANYSKSLTKILGILGVTGVSCLTMLPAQAQEIRNAEYNNKTDIAQSVNNGRTNSRPSIFNEPPYNGRTRTPGVVPPANQERQQPTATAVQNIVEIAEGSSSFQTLSAALKAAGLEEILKGEGPFTVFAPTDGAFAKLPPDALQTLLKPENKEVLIKVLTYHVVPGKVKSTDLKSGQVKSLEGGQINVKVDPSQGVMVNDSKVIQADIEGKNGVIHAIDTVILPPDL